MNAKQTEALKAFRNAFGGAKKYLWLFPLGIITGVSIVGFFEAIEYQSIYNPSLPWWVYVVSGAVAAFVAGRLSEH